MNNTNLENFLSSLFYLEREADKEGYKTVSIIIKSAINKINIELQKDKIVYLQEELGSELYNALNIVGKVRKIDADQLKLLSDVIMSIKTRDMI